MFNKLRKKVEKSLVSLLCRLYPKTIVPVGDFGVVSYSQEGEDRILQRLFEGKTEGFYVDVGAHHPVRFSNTYLFYTLGWRGINIDAMPGSMEPFKKLRPHDINLEEPVSDREELLTYYIFNEPVLNGFSSDLSKERDGINDNQFHIVDTVELRTKTLEQLLDHNLPENQQIDFLSVDVEGLDLQVLRSNNWLKYMPEVVLVEIYAPSVDLLMKEDIHEYLQSLGYLLFGRCVHTALYKKGSIQ